MGMDRELVYDLAESVTGKSVFSHAQNRRSLTMLNRTERWKLIRDLKAKGAFHYRSAPKGADRPAQGETLGRGSGRDIISPAQQDFIETLFIELASLDADFGKPEYRKGFIRIILGKEWPQKKWEAQKIIEAIKRRIKQEKKKDLAALKGPDKPAQGEALGIVSEGGDE